MKHILFRSVLILCSAVLVFIGLEYNDQRTNRAGQVLAQDMEIVCSDKEIPVGSLINEADKFQKEILTSLFQISYAARAQIEESEILLGLEKQYGVEYCKSSCTKKTVCGETGCTSYCEKNACSGNPYSSGTKEKVATQLTNINSYYTQVKNARDVINNLLTKPVPSPFAKNCPTSCQTGGGGGCPQECLLATRKTHIMKALDQSRKALRACVTPVNEQTPEEETLQRIDRIISCQEAKTWNVLNNTQQQCATNNFFCCTLQEVK